MTGLWTTMFLLGCLCQSSANKPEIATEPEFAEPIPNVTVSAGRQVSMPCVVDNLGTYRVAWIHTDRYTLLTLQNRVITRNSRYRVTHNAHRTWWLHIEDVQERDRGQYMCQINTSPMKSQVGYIEVVVPPQIDEVLTSSDSEVKEGSDMSLRCVAKGSPEPNITWRREDGQDITSGKKKLSSVKGPYLNVSKVSRLHMAAYLCIAANGVPPSVSKRIVLSVNFAPMIWIPNQLIGAPLGTDVTVDCNLESQPRSVTYWAREGGIMILSNTKYDSMLLPTGIYKVQMKLKIKNLRPEDFGSYTCVAKNSLGETEGTIRLYEIPPPSSTSSSQGPEAFHAKSEKLQNGQSPSAISRPGEKETSSHSRENSEGKMRNIYPLSTEVSSDSATTVAGVSRNHSAVIATWMCIVITVFQIIPGIS